jgi:hypothetical protein|tara:strand:- start:435 stop:650 length:216 start_codon:yes stop_codon:yes gene_type:complete
MTITNQTIDEVDRDLLFRQSRLLYPDVEEWILEMSIEAYINSLDKTEEEDEQNTVNMSKKCDDEICLACGS